MDYPKNETGGRITRKRKNTSDDYDIEIQRPAKRHGSDSASSSCSSVASPESCIDSPSAILVSSDDDTNSQQSVNQAKTAIIHTKTFVINKTISSSDEDDVVTMGQKKLPVAATAKSDIVAHNSKLDSSSNLSNNNKKKKNPNVEVNSECSSSSESSVPSDNGSDDFYVAEFDLPDLESPADALSPAILEPSINSEWVSKGDKTPHSSSRKSIGYKTVVCEKPPCYVVPTSELRTCPLPALNWTSANDMWKIMHRKDERASLERESNMFQNHPGLQSRMRAILLDWLIEVCEVYKLHRETYYLTVDYLDRYLTARKDVSKNQLQLIGITCLFVASKVEEIYPPKLTEFAYVTDGACSEEDILQQEILLLQALNWNVSPVTVMGWLSIYMQLNVTTCKSAANSTHRQQTKSEILLNTSKYGKSFIYPQFSGYKFVKTAQLIDLCSLDVDIADFPYSVVAAAAMSHLFDKNTATNVSGLDWASISPCAKWMEPYYQVLEEDSENNPLVLLEANDQVKTAYGLSHICPNVNSDESHIIQTHTISLDLFDKGILRREQLESTEAMIRQEASPAQPIAVPCPEGILTPPASNRKSL